MGIKGLTTYIKQRSDHCMEQYELHDTSVVIDGDAVLCHLYMNHTDSKNGCFGGDYDKYGNTIYKFFTMLFQCKVTPYIILDGGYESRKMDRIIQRFQNRIDQAQAMNPKTESSNSTTPLFIRESFEDIALKLGVKLIRCDFEGDRETANIAKALQCPVISNDSDFYIFDVPYIPFDSVHLSVKTKVTQGQNTCKYIQCRMFNIDKFLCCVGNLSKNNLPLFAALVGNDFIDGIELSKLGIQTKSKNIYIRIENVIEWLRNKTKESAIEQILKTYDDNNKDIVSKKLRDSIDGYTFKESKYLKYLTNQSVVEYSNSEMEECEFNTYEKLTSSFPKPFIENFRKSLYPTRFMDILTQNKYYNFKPQIEVTVYEQAHDVSIQIITAIHKILCGASENLICLLRSNYNAVEKTLPLCEIDLPSFTDIQTMNIDMKKSYIITILNIDHGLFLNSFPDTWHLLILTLKYMINKSVISLPVVYSIILCKLIIDYIDPKIGFFRSTDSFNEAFDSKLKKLSNRQVLQTFSKNLKNCLNSISDDDAIVAFHRLVPFFELNKVLRRDLRFYDRKLMHSLSEFQSCLLHVKSLNQLFNKPYHDFLITECFNGTFVYNMSAELNKRNNLETYFKFLLNEAPSILNGFELIINLLYKIQAL